MNYGNDGVSTNYAKLEVHTLHLIFRSRDPNE